MSKPTLLLLIVYALALLSGCKYWLNPWEQMEVCDHCISWWYQCEYVYNDVRMVNRINCVLPPSTDKNE